MALLAKTARVSQFAFEIGTASAARARPEYQRIVWQVVNPKLVRNTEPPRAVGAKLDLCPIPRQWVWELR